LIDLIKLNDKDLEKLLHAIKSAYTFEGEIIIKDQNITNETAINIANILKKNHPKIVKLDLSGNKKLGNLAGLHLGQALTLNHTLTKI